ncbi:helix-turn-helix domain-containing protein [Clostridium tertium]|uniref:helix-turn-helix domain-containing protein n=1 Tax=Clostridium tertium TaxID=1559 RepID=UPI0024B3BD6C|nr:helix-turn-helix transcriptional regulator [Clostridium tertium]MDI9215983.1 helix-turn-helix domain-containing protein [Clostridium tertium]
MFGKNIKYIRESKNIGVNELSRLSGVNASYISALERDEKKNPSVAILEKLANALEVNIDEIMKSDSVRDNDLKRLDKNSEQVKEEVELYETGEFKTAEAAMQFILKQPAIMGYGGFDAEKLSKEEIIEFANELLKQLQLLGLKYKK